MKSSSLTPALILLLSVVNFPLHALSQDSNIRLPIAEIERKLKFETFEVKKIEEFEHLRFQALAAKVKLPKRVTLKLGDGSEMRVRWKTSERGGQAFNNQPRYQIAAYRFQQLFLDSNDYVVPPTVGRCLPVGQYRGIERNAKATFKNTEAVFFVLQYWLDNVTDEDIYDEVRFKSDSIYARHFANMNIFSCLIKHSDSNKGNFLISTDRANPRVFAVDNDIAFGKAESDRGTEWQKIRVKRLPQKTIERLRKITLQDIKKSLDVVAQYKIMNGQLITTEVTRNLDERKGVRQEDDIVQFGLTSKEIDGIYSRLKKLLNQVDSGKIETF